MAISSLPSNDLFAEQKTDTALWYSQPASRWVEALAIGNGRLGAMVFGGVAREQISLNDDTLYSGEPQSRNIALDVPQGFDQVVSWLRQGQNSYQPLGDLRLLFEVKGPVANYRRELDISRAIATTTYTQNGGKV